MPERAPRREKNDSHGAIDALLNEILDKRGSTCTSSRAIHRASACTATSQPSAGEARSDLREGGDVRDHAEDGRDRFESKDGADFAYTLGIAPLPRERDAQLNGVGAVFGHPSKAFTLDELKLPESVRQMSRANQA